VRASRRLAHARLRTLRRLSRHRRKRRSAPATAVATAAWSRMSPLKTLTRSKPAAIRAHALRRHAGPRRAQSFLPQRGAARGADRGSRPP
jgi:hypothetical protein